MPSIIASIFRACGGIGASCDQGCQSMARFNEPTATDDAKSALKKLCQKATNAVNPPLPSIWDSLKRDVR